MLCARSIRFVRARASPAAFRFAPRRSAEAHAALAPFPAAQNVDGVLLVEGKRLYARSAAALRIAGALRPPWPLFGVLWIVPRAIRDAVYDAIARRRYRWFGRLTDE